MPISSITPPGSSLQQKTFIATEGADVPVLGLRKGAAVVAVIVNGSATSTGGTLGIGFNTGGTNGEELVTGLVLLDGTTVYSGMDMLDQTTGLYTNGVERDRQIMYSLVGAGAGPYAVTILYADFK